MMIRKSGKQKKSKLRIITVLLNVGTAIDHFRIILNQMVNLKWSMLNVHAQEPNDTFIYIILISDMSTE